MTKQKVSIRRYELSSLDVNDFITTLDRWTKERRCKFFKDYKFYWGAQCSLIFGISPIGKEHPIFNECLWFYYISPILYVATTYNLPIECNDIFDNLITPWVMNSDGKVIDYQCQVFAPTIRDIFKHPPDFFKDQQNNSQTQTRVQQTTKVHLNTDNEKIKTNSETVTIPSGVLIRIKRSRTIEHTVDISWRNLKSTSLDFGVKDVVSVSIINEIEKYKGRSYTESETMDYEIELNGANACQYNLVWTDIWCKGVIELTIDEMTQIIPFRFREASELEVIPLKNI